MKKETENFIKKVHEFNKKDKFDLSTDEDLSIAIMNLISIEEHFFFTAEKTGKGEYFDLLKDVREIRKQLLKRIIKEYEGEVWCISKHLLAASMRLMEVGTKLLSQDKKDEAEEIFNKSYDLYSLFWGIVLKVVDTNSVKKIDDEKIDVQDKNDNSVFTKLKGIVKRAIDCCIE